MKSDIRVCSEWADNHEWPVYTLKDECPKCGATTENTAPAPFDPADPYGGYRRALKERTRE